MIYVKQSSMFMNQRKLHLDCNIHMHVQWNKQTLTKERLPSIVYCLSKFLIWKKVQLT